MTQETRAQWEAFKAVKVKHPRLDEADQTGPEVRLAYYRQVILALKAHVVVKELLVHITTAPTRTRGSRHVTAWLALREAVAQALARLHVQAVGIDEAPHLRQVAAPRKPADQLDWLKSMTNRTNVLHGLVGTYA